jgi:hypothetical protein
MPQRRRPQSPPVGPAIPSKGPGAGGGRSRSRADGGGSLRRIERMRRALGRENGDGSGNGTAPLPMAPAEYYVRATWVSFVLEGLEVSEEEVREALDPGSDRAGLRARQNLRLRNHAAILHRIENDLAQGLPLTGDGVLRWYVAMSAGLSTTGLDQATAARLDEVVRRVNAPQLRVGAALREVAETHVRLLGDALVPSFNGILARLLLRYHLGRCGLPAVVFDPQFDGRRVGADGMLRRLMELLEVTYDRLPRGGA